MDAAVLPVGKLPATLLDALLRDLPGRADVVVGARYGEDAAVIQVGDRYLVAAMDPVTLSAEPGGIAVQINANDVAVMGADPRWLLASVLLPSGSAEEQVQAVMDDLRRHCSALGVALIGGHTEVSPAVTQPVVVGCMLGETTADRLVLGSGARPGDRLLLAGPIAVEGTGILAREFAGDLRGAGVPEATIGAASALLDRPGISILPAVRALTARVLPHAMHDPTEGGLLGAVREVAAASGTGVRLEGECIPILPACRAICRALGLDPLRLLASGSLLAALAPQDLGGARRALEEAGIEARDIGGVLPPDAGMIWVDGSEERPLPQVERDELARWGERRGEAR